MSARKKKLRKKRNKSPGIRTRVTSACIKCKEKKTKCEDARPCLQCRNHGYTCIPKEPSKRGPPKKIEIQSKCSLNDINSRKKINSSPSSSNNIELLKSQTYYELLSFPTFDEFEFYDECGEGGCEQAEMDNFNKLFDEIIDYDNDNDNDCHILRSI